MVQRILNPKTEPTPEELQPSSITGVFFGVVPTTDRKFMPVRLDIAQGVIKQTDIGSPSSAIETIYAVASDALERHGLDSAQYRYGKTETKKERSDA